MASEQFQRTTGMAIEILTAQFSDTSSTSFASERIGLLKDQDLPDLCVGLVNVAGSAIEELSKQMQVPPLELLQRFALNLQREGQPSDQP